jgi:hypothetical protein
MGTTVVEGEPVLLVSRCQGEIGDVGVSALLQNVDSSAPDTTISAVARLVELREVDLRNVSAFRLDTATVSGALPEPYDLRLVRVHLTSGNGGAGYETVLTDDIPQYPDVLVNVDSSRRLVQASELGAC